MGATCCRGRFKGGVGGGGRRLVFELEEEELLNCLVSSLVFVISSIFELSSDSLRELLDEICYFKL